MTTRFKFPKPGTCRVCGCIEQRACPGGCWWTDKDKTLCSACAGTERDIDYSLNWVARLLNSEGDRRSLINKTYKIAVGALRRQRDRHAVA